MNRRGFTLVELLMVIVVISILTGLLVVAVPSVLSSSREAQTKSIVHKAWRVIQDSRSAFEQQLHAVFDAHEWKYIRARLTKAAGADATMTTILQGIKDRISAAVPTEQGREADLLARIETERLTFPQTWAEADWMLHSVGQSITWTVNQQTENSEVLYWLLMNAPTNEGESIPATAHKDTDGNGKDELLDAWGNQIRFYRWPTRINSSQAIAKKYFTPSDSKDPNNPLNLLSGTIVEPEYYAPQLYHTPLVVSAGLDGNHGLRNPASKADGGYWGEVMPEDVVPEPPMAPVILENPGHIWAFDDITDR